MNSSSHVRFMFCITVLPFAVVGCASVPSVESRLQSLQLGPNTYVARAGDSLDTVAFRYRLQPQDLIAMNPHLSGEIMAGDRVIVHQFDAPAVQTVAPTTYSSGTARSNQSITVQGSPAPNQLVNSGSINGTPVTVQPNGNNIVSAITYPTATVPTPDGAVAFDQIREIPANARNANSVRLPVEEIVPDELDAGLTYSTLPTVSEEQRLAAQANGRAGRSVLSAPSGNDVSGWIWPTFGEVARDFAPSEAGGQGIDIAGVPGQEIHAASGGTVAYAGRELSGGNGKLIILRHHSGLMTTYSHADQIFVAEDDVVRAGDVIASLGSNARNESVLRFEVRQDGNPLNPMNFLTN